MFLFNFLLKKLKVPEQLPAEIPTMTGWHQVDDILKTGLTTGVYTAAVCLAGREGELMYHRAVGRLSRAADSPPTTLETVFDLASITKTLATTLALILLVQQGRLSLLADLGELLSWLPDDKKCLPLVSLLTHQSGLPAWKPFYQTVLTLPAPERPGCSGEAGRGRTLGTYPRQTHHLQRSGVHAFKSRH